jgi:hypothetical protein
MKFDIIGDIHGHADELIQLLEELGYKKTNGNYRHTETERKAIFVGDFIDRGPEIKQTLEIVKPMVDNCAAHAVLGNHEYNALCFHTKKAGHHKDWLRPRNDKNINQHIETLCQFKDDSDEWKKYLDWFMTLPLFLDLGKIRVVHAAWIPSEIEKISKWTSNNRNLTKRLLQKSALEGFDEFDTIETVLKGVEIPLPEGQHINDKDENPRKEIRIRWWEPAVNKTYGEMVFPKTSLDCENEKIDAGETAKLSAYNKSVPVFFGHYWREPDKHELRVQKENICCLDYSIAKGGSLVAYRWEGESNLNKKNFYKVERHGD